jgi:hypothetical protein
VKLLTDADYRDNQYDAQRRWREHHKEYWSRYRVSHPDYVERNRELQRERNHHRRGGTLIVKRDELSLLNSFKSGFYRLIPAGGDGIAKRDEYIVKLDFLSVTYALCPTLDEQPAGVRQLSAKRVEGTKSVLLRFHDPK